MNEIGEILKDARIEQGYTLDDLQQITKIQKRYLQAIENGNNEILPGRFYERAFIKQYADIVGLDGEQLLEEHVNQSSKDASEEFAENVNVAPTRSGQGDRSGFLDNLTENLPTILIFLLVAAIFIVIYFAWRQQSGNGNGESAIINENNTEQVEEAPVTDETNNDANNEEETTTEDAGNTEENTDENTDENTNENLDQNSEENSGENTDEETQEVGVANTTGASTTYEVTGTHPEEQTVSLTANGGDSWVSVSVDGGAEEAQLLSDGQSLDVSFSSDTSTVDIVVGNAGVTDVSLNGTALETPPEAEGVIRQDLQLQFSE